MFQSKCPRHSRSTMFPQLKINTSGLSHLCTLDWVRYYILDYVSFTPVQLPDSLELPVHGLFPPVKVLVRLQVASLSHVPEQIPHAFQVAHVPSTEITHKKIISDTSFQTLSKISLILTLAAYSVCIGASAWCPSCVSPTPSHSACTITSCSASTPSTPSWPASFN